MTAYHNRITGTDIGPLPALDAPGEAPSLLDDLLEDSERVFHRDLAKFQILQARRFGQFLKALQDQVEKVCAAKALDPATLGLRARAALLKYRALNEYQRRNHMELLRMQQRVRDQGIRLFVMEREGGARPGPA